MKKVTYLFCLSLLLFVACQNDGKEKGTLSEDKMVAILTELHQIEAQIVIANLPSDSSKMYYAKYQKDLFDKYQTDSSTFNNSFKYYLENSKSFSDIYARVVDSLSLKESKNSINVK